MKPELSRLQCTSTFTSELSVRANLDYAPTAKSDLCFDKLDIKPKVTKVLDSESSWQVVLKTVFDAAAVENAAYSFTVEVVGFFTCIGIKPKAQARFVRIQACSILYGMSRDALLDAMNKGPWNPIFLPLASFYTPKDEEPEALQTHQKSNQDSSTPDYSG
jgi:preprotein translocase subunit SecB